MAAKRPGAGDSHTPLESRTPHMLRTPRKEGAMIQRLTCLLGLLALGVAATSAGAQSATFRVIVHASTGAGSLPRAELARLFLKKASTWPDGKAAIPVDQAESSAVRRAFSKAVLERDVSAVRAYWQQQIFSGRGVPPLERASDAEVLAYVRTHPGAIGYVSSGADLGPSLKELRVD
jgi:hypothetical protein